MDGLSATRAIRASGDTRTVIVAVTAHAMTGDRDRCLEAGADEYLAKPISGEKLFEAIDRAMAARRRHAA
jgi:CheY-like chemotaxis protein